MTALDILTSTEKLCFARSGLFSQVLSHIQKDASNAQLIKSCHLMAIMEQITECFFFFKVLKIVMNNDAIYD